MRLSISKNKIIRHLSLRILHFLCKGTVYDKTVLIKKTFIKTLKNIVSAEKTDAIIVTGAPFNLMYYAACELGENVDIVTIADYRDPWITAQNYGMQFLNAERKLHEQTKQNKVHDTFDFIVAPNDFLLEEIKNSYTGQKNNNAKYFSLPHAFDEDDYEVLDTLIDTERKEIDIVYGGAIYIGTEDYLLALSDALLLLNKQGIRAKCTLYTPDANRFKNRFQGLVFEESLGNKFYNRIAKADFLIMLYANHNKNYLTTKFYEYLPLRKPLLYIGPEGYISETIAKKNLGYILADIKSDLGNIIHNSASKTQSNSMTDLQEFSYKTRTFDLLTLLNK